MYSNEAILNINHMFRVKKGTCYEYVALYETFWNFII